MKGYNKVGAWMVIVAGVGTAIGAALDHVALGVAFGPAIGMLIGSILSSRSTKDDNNCKKV